MYYYGADPGSSDPTAHDCPDGGGNLVKCIRQGFGKSKPKKEAEIGSDTLDPTA